MSWGFTFKGTFPAFSTAASSFLATLTNPHESQQATRAVDDAKMVATELHIQSGQPGGLNNPSGWTATFDFALNGYADGQNGVVNSKVFLSPHQTRGR